MTAWDIAFRFWTLPAGLANFVENLMETGDRPLRTHTATPMWLAAHNLRGLVSFSEVSLSPHTKEAFETEEMAQQMQALAAFAENLSKI